MFKVFKKKLLKKEVKKMKNLCKYCGNETKRYKFKDKYKKFCSNSCRITYSRSGIRKVRRERKLCIDCGTKILPKVIFPVRCEICKKRSQDYDKKYKSKKEEENGKD